MKFMNKLQDKLKKAKKDNKGFSLVELIIVIAIMAILVGIVGTQVIPYINKSKVSKDQQVLNSISTAAVTAYSELGLTGDVEVDVLGTTNTAGTDAEKINDAIKNTAGFENLAAFKDALESDKADTITKITFKVEASDHKATTSVTYGTPSDVKYPIKDVTATL